MKALILAAGYATRLYPLTENQPKPLLKIAGKPIIDHIIDKIAALSDVNEIFIVTNARFYQNFKEWSDSFSGSKKITLINDGTLTKEDRLGAIGDINFVLKDQSVDEDLLVIGGDNLFEEELPVFHEFFRKADGSVLTLYDVKDLEQAKLFNNLTLDKDQKILQFEEKPLNPTSTLIATLIYFLKKEHLQLLPQAINNGFADRAGDFIKYLSQRKPVYGLPLRGRWFDIGSFKALTEAEEFYQKKL